MIDKKEKLDNDLSIIVKKLEKFEADAIILYGGYGRDEGSWFLNKDGSFSPYNDYDILLVSENKLDAFELEKLRPELAEEIGIRWIDISQMTPRRLSKLRNSIYSYDLKYASKVIAGAPNILDIMPEIDARNLPLREGEILFFTRIWTLLGYLDENGFQQDRAGEDSRFFRNQMAKAILAVVDILLLQKEAYHSSYKIRVKRISELYPDKAEFCALSQWALNEKLCPKDDAMTGKEVESLYSKVHNCFFEEMKKLLSKYYRKQIRSIEDIEKCLRCSGLTIMKRCYFLLRRRNLSYERQFKITLAQIYIAGTYSDGKINVGYLQKGIDLMKSVNHQLDSAMSWDKARVIVAEMRLSG